MKELPQVLVNAKVPNDKKNIYLEDIEIIEAINFKIKIFKSL